MTAASKSSPNPMGPVAPVNPLLTFLHQLQETALKILGPKFDVDLSLKTNLSMAQDAFNRLPRTENGTVSSTEFDKFMKSYLNGAEDDLVYTEPVDFLPEQEGFWPAVENPAMREGALEVHFLWKNLCRRVSRKAYSD